MSHLSPQMTNAEAATSEDFWLRTVLRKERSERWLSRTASDMDEAARAWSPPFTVGQTAIKEKLVAAKKLVVLANDEIVAGFASVTHIKRLRRSRLRARYIEGVIVHPKVGGAGKFRRLMDGSERAEIEILHTQNPQILEGMKSRSAGIFPDPELLHVMGDDLHADIREFLADIGREKTDFDPLTGIVPDLYERCLYGSWPIPGHENSLSFTDLNPTSGVLVAGFENPETARYWIRPVTREARR